MDTFRKIANFTVSFKRWAKAGMPRRSPDWVRQIFETHCAECDRYDPQGLTFLRDKGVCLECGCHVDPYSQSTTNKLVWPTEGCPLEPPKFRAIVESEGEKSTSLKIGTIDGKDPRSLKNANDD